MNTLYPPVDVLPVRSFREPGLRWYDRGHNAWLLLAALWLGYALIWLGISSDAIAHMGFRDPDDALRLVQVRDFLAGQSWFDVSQHRINPPLGGPMHWSRLVDLPIAGLILLLRPFIGTSAAELAACAIVPLLTLGVIALALFAAMRRFMGSGFALLTIGLLGLSFPIIVQMTPMRIDHHAWQAAMAMITLYGLLHPDPRRGGWIMGAAMAMWLHISSEGLPYAAIAGAILALRHAARREEWQRLIRYAGLMAAGSALLLLLTHGWQQSLASHCDAISPVYLGPLVLLPPLLLIGHRLAGEDSALRRLLPTILAGLCVAGLFAATAGPCLAGPFRTLSPRIYDLWYLGVREGQPLWSQKPALMIISLLPMLVGLAGIGAASWSEKDATRRLQWLSILALALGSSIVAVLVMRAITIAHLFALIGQAWIIARLYPSIAARPTMIARVLLSSALVAFTPVGLALIGDQSAALLPSSPAQKDDSPKGAFENQDVDQLLALPPGTIFAPLDVGPAILVRTPHSVIGTGHHRNVVGIGKVIDAFVAPPEQARRIIAGTNARYLLFLPRLAEETRYARFAPQGLAAQMQQGRIPGWLTPMDRISTPSLRVFHIEDGKSAADAPAR